MAAGRYTGGPHGRPEGPRGWPGPARPGQIVHNSGTANSRPGTNQCAPTEAAARPAIFAEIARCPEPQRLGPAPAVSNGSQSRPSSPALVLLTASATAKQDRGREMSQKPIVTRPKSLKAKMATPEVDLGFDWGVLNTALLTLGVAVL